MDSFIEMLVDKINNLDPAEYLPEIDSIVGWVVLLVRIFVMAAPVIMLLFGLSYLLLPAKEANHMVGYRFYFGMGSIPAWRFTQRLAGIVWSGLGLVLSVVRFFVSNGFGGMDGMAMLDKAVVCILWEIGLIAVACIAINVVLIVRYDRKGQPRFRR